MPPSASAQRPAAPGASPRTRRQALMLAAGGLLMPLGCSASGQPGEPAQADWHVFNWRSPGRPFGGFSGIHLDDNGLDFIAVADSGRLFMGSFTRNEAGHVVDAEIHSVHRLRDESGSPLRGRYRDSEGIAVAPDGTIFISFEGGRRTRVAAYAHPDAPAHVLPTHPLFFELPGNLTLESLAIDGSGRLYTMPQSPHEGRFPLMRLESDEWRIIGALEPMGGHHPVSLDFGPDGMLYLLERNFRWFAYSSRISRLRPGQWDRREVLVQTEPGLLENHEGLAVTRDSAGRLRATLISDDNELPFQRTQIAERLLD
ncbi:MAG: esterase-like activity of phytase family protein [Pararhodobacter sp.]|nr:esterase-like activity of phytase family protein [Pararhodobacter sp.]